MSEDARIPITSSLSRDNRHVHVDPLVDAEVRWGNEIAEDWHITDSRLSHWGLTLARPFHVDEVRARFSFPSDVGLYVVGARRRREVPTMCLSDILGVARVTAPLPEDWPHGEGQVEL